MGKTFRNIPSSYFTPLQNFCLDYQFIEYSNCSDDYHLSKDLPVRGESRGWSADSSHEVPFPGKYLSHSPVSNCPLTLSSGNSRSKCNCVVSFSCGCTEFRKTTVHQAELPTTPLVTAEPSLAFDQRSSKWFPAFWIKKVRLKSQNNLPVMFCIDLTLIWALIRPFEQQFKHFHGKRRFLWELWANSGSIREARLAQRGFAVPAPECLGALSASPAWRARHTPRGKAPCHRQAAPLGREGHLHPELPWEQRGCMTPTPWHPRARHTAFNHPLTCVSPYSMHLPEETLGWSGRTHYTWINNGCQNKCNFFWGIWWNQGWNLLPCCQTVNTSLFVCSWVKDLLVSPQGYGPDCSFKAVWTNVWRQEEQCGELHHFKLHEIVFFDLWNPTLVIPMTFTCYTDEELLKNCKTDIKELGMSRVHKVTLGGKINEGEKMSPIRKRK